VYIRGWLVEQSLVDQHGEGTKRAKAYLCYNKMTLDVEESILHKYKV
jgi:hypothetical protein